MLKVELFINNQWQTQDTTLNCLGVDTIKIIIEPEAGYIFTRTKVMGSLVFNSKKVNGISIFHYVKELNEMVIYEREKIGIKITIDNFVFTGNFDSFNCKWDYDREIFEVTPIAYDKYYDFLNKDLTANIKRYPSTMIQNGYYTQYAKSVAECILNQTRYLKDISSLLGYNIAYGAEYDVPCFDFANYYIMQKTNVTKVRNKDGTINWDLEEAQKQNLSFLPFMNFLRDYYNLYWDIQENPNYDNNDPSSIKYFLIINYYHVFTEHLNTIDLRLKKGLISSNKFYPVENKLPNVVNVEIAGDSGQIVYKEGIGEKKISISDFAVMEYYYDYDTPDGEGGIIEGEGENYDPGKDGFLFHETYKEYSDNVEVIYVASTYLFGTMAKDTWHYGREYAFGIVNDKPTIMQSTESAILQDITVNTCEAYSFNDGYKTNLFDVFGLATLKRLTYSAFGQTDMMLGYSKNINIPLVILDFEYFNNRFGSDTWSPHQKLSWKVLNWPHATFSFNVSVRFDYTGTATQQLSGTCRTIYGLNTADGYETFDIDPRYNIAKVYIIHNFLSSMKYYVLTNVQLIDYNPCI